MKKNLLLWVLLFSFKVLVAQHDSSYKKKITTKQKLIIAGLTATQVGTVITSYNWWWKGQYHGFNMHRDGAFNNYSLGVDKAGHFYTSYWYYHALNELMKWGDFSDRSRQLTSIIVPIAWALSIEIGDGFTKLGFSKGDLLANSLGIGYGLLQDKVPYMRNFKFKMSYWKTSYYDGRQAQPWSLTDDYGGHFYWLTFDIHNILPKRIQHIWPQFLNIATGYGITSVYLIQREPQLRKFGIGLDWNLGAIKIKSKALHTAKSIADYWHFPTPGVKFIDGGENQREWLLLR